MKKTLRENSCDLTVKQWNRLQIRFPILKEFSKAENTFNGLLYKVISGDEWGCLPSSFPSVDTIKDMRDELREEGTLIDIVDYLQKHSYFEDIYSKFDRHLKEEDQERLGVNGIG